MTDKNILLVHGSCHGAWCWDRLVPHLSARGLRVRVLDLPGHGADRTPASEVTLDAYAEAVVRTMRDGGGRWALLGHSAGGYAISAAAMRAPELVEKLIFLCAYLPVSGKSLSEMRKVWHEQPLVPAIRRSADGHSFTFDPQRLRDLFYHDCTDADVAFAAANVCPQPMAPQVTRIAVNAMFETLEKHYIVCEADRAIPPDYQRVMAGGLPPHRVRALPSSHSPFLSMPGPLAALIDENLSA